MKGGSCGACSMKFNGGCNWSKMFGLKKSKRRRSRRSRKSRRTRRRR